MVARCARFIEREIEKFVEDKEQEKVSESSEASVPGVSQRK